MTRNRRDTRILILIYEQETLYTNSAALAYLVSSVLQLIFTNKEEYKISLEFHDYYHDYIVAGVSSNILYEYGYNFLIQLRH